MSKITIYSLILAISTFTTIKIVVAQVLPSSFINEMDPKAPPVLNLEVLNSYDNRIVFVETQSLKVINPGSEDESTSSDLSLLVSPKTFSLGAKEKRVVRLLLKERPKDREEVYRVNFIPRSFSPKEGTEELKPSRGLNLSVLFGSGVLVFAPPLNAESKIEWKKNEKGYTLKNIGIKNLDIRVTSVCEANGENCRDIKFGKRLYSGKEIEISDGPLLNLTRELIPSGSQKLTINTDEGTYLFPD